MFYVYILESIRTGRHHIGEAEDIASRLLRHNTGRVLATRQHRPWKLVHQEEFSTRSDARLRERRIKRYKGGVQFKALLNGTLRKP